MAQIHVLDKKTIDQIAAGEVIERPSSVVKELVENAIDAGATAITVEIKNGGIDLIRVTDNGSGIEKDEIRTAFLPHATSKIQDASDLFKIASLGFRGEALPSIASVTKTEVITKRKGALIGYSYEICGGEETAFSEIGAPEGTTFLVKELFYNTPVRRKFLKTAITEGSYIADLLEKMALSHPNISFRLQNGAQTKLFTTGSGNLKELIYTLYGRETAKEIREIRFEKEGFALEGYLGNPVIAKGNRGFENYFVNGRYVKSNLVAKAIEDAYAPFMMQHRYPFCVLYLTLPPEDFDVNVHPTKMELRFREEAKLYDLLYGAIKEALAHKEFIPDVEAEPEDKKKEKIYRAPEPFENKKNEDLKEKIRKEVLKISDSEDIIISKPPEKQEDTAKELSDWIGRFQEKTVVVKESEKQEDAKTEIIAAQPKEAKTEKTPAQPEEPSVKTPEPKPQQMDLFETRLISEEGMKKFRLIGQVFETYWLLQMEEKLYILDQHAAHEKILYERKMKEIRERQPVSQLLSLPVMVSLSSREELVLNRTMEEFSRLGYEISSYGGREYCISAVPDDLYGLDAGALFTEILSDMESEVGTRNHEMILSKLASASCKAAVKGNHILSYEEADHLIRELLTLENPYACPHGRPTLISISKRELEKKFKRIV